ncbi:glutaredoxin [Candidozyma pseudohaemuli]|uniref:Glutaredoxin n=1 Tax=Candidozyma pseudohaemuli TaxID=418784 RepID=A0A2P7YYB6_9ASCO|nr:glutaredoxin [[Candida] pseudohaemulonii]PSK40963.1 glutaredoxin [[Candida] pseudohaemulonii]
MVSNRKIRVLALAVGITLLTTILLLTRESRHKNVLVAKQAAGSTLLESANNAQVDAAINEEISKTKGKEDAESNGEIQQETPEDDSTTEEYDPAKQYREIRALAPMTIFSKSYCPFSKRLKQLLLDSYNIVPPPTIVELDKLKQGKELQAYLGEITGRKTVPNVLVGASNPQSRGGADDFIDLHNKGELESSLNTWGDKELLVTKKEIPSNV